MVNVSFRGVLISLGGSCHLGDFRRWLVTMGRKSPK